MSTLLATVRTRVMASPVAQRLAVGAAWSIAGVVAERLANLASTVLIVRLLGRESFGQLAILQSTLGFAGVFAGLGLGITATRYVAELRNRDPERLARILAFTSRAALASGVLIAVLLVLGSNFLAERVLNIPDAGALIVLSSLAVLFNALQGYQSGALIGFEAVKQSTLGGLATAVISIPVSVTLAAWYGLHGAVMGLVAAAVVRWLINRSLLAGCMARWNISRAPRDWLSEWRAMRDFALPALLSGAMIAPAHWVCHAMLINAPDGRAQMAVVGIVNQWFYAVLLLPFAAARIVLPVLTDGMAGNRDARGAKVLRLGVLANAVMVLPFALILAVASPWIMGLYGDAYRAEWPVLAIAVSTAALVAVQTPVGSMIAATGRMWLGAVMNLGWAVAYVVGSWLLVERGAMGVALALACAYCIHSVWTFGFAAGQLRSGRPDSKG